MIQPSKIISFLEEQEITHITGVPCSYFKEFLDHLNSDQSRLNHILANREDEAVGIASGLAFAHKKVVVYMQNSGLGNIGDAVTSLAQLYQLPMLLLVSYRGLQPDQDFPEHSIMGKVTEPMLKAMNLPFWQLTEEQWEHEIQIALKVMRERSIPVVLLVKKGVLSS